MKLKPEQKLRQNVNWKAVILDCAGQGMGIAETITEIGLTKYAHEYLLKEDKEYLEAFEEGRLISEAWWMKQGRVNLENKNYNNTMWIFNMKNRFAWRDQPILTKGDGGSAFDDIREKELLISKYQSKELKAEIVPTDNIN